MRLGVGGFAVAIVLAGALAVPSMANHEHIVLQAVDARVELPSVNGGDVVPMRFTWSPEDTFFERSNIHICWNGRFDRSRLLENPFPVSACSSGSAGLNSASSEDFSHAHYDTISAGRYEAFIQRETPCEENCFPPPPRHFNASNVVVVEAVDPCRLRLASLRTRGFHFPLEVGSPMSCATLLATGELEAVSEDGTRIALTAAGPISVEYVTRNPFTSRPTPGPIFRLRAGGNTATVTFTTGGHLGHLVTSASTGAVHVLAVAPASARLTFRNGVGRVRVLRGRVVALGVGPYEAALEIERYCGRRPPTITCLSRMRYRFFTMRRGTSIRARVLRAGQSATFRRRRGVIKFVR